MLLGIFAAPKVSLGLIRNGVFLLKVHSVKMLLKDYNLILFKKVKIFLMFLKRQSQ